MEVHSAKTHHVDIFGINSPRFHFFKHFFAVHMTGSAIGMGNHHNLLYAKFKDSNEQTTNHTTKRMGNNTSRILYHFYIAILYTQRGRQ